MKKNIRTLLSFCLCFFCAASVVSAQKEKRQITPAEAKEWAAAEVAENSLAKFSAAEKADAKEKAQAVAAYVFKAILHRSDPANYPLDATQNSLEMVAMKLVNKMPAATFDKIKGRATSLLTDATKRAAVLGKFKNIDFKKRTIDPDVKSIRDLKFQPAAMQNDAAVIQPIQESYSSGVGGPSVVENLPAFGHLDLVLRALHCVDETNPETPGDDDMVIGGIIVGASGNTKKAQTYVSCHFDDGDYCNMGVLPFGTYSLSAGNGYPKTFYCILQLIEVDTDEQEAADALNEVLGIVAEMLGNVYGEEVGAVASAIASAVEVFTGWLIDDDPFHPYGFAKTITSSNAFGADGRSANFHTGNISDVGGTYRVGFYWQMRN